MRKVLLDEKLILAKVANGDQHAFATLFNHYKAKVYGYAISLLHNEEAAEEIVQDIFIKLWLKRDVVTNLDSFEGFLIRMVRNDTLNALKKIAIEFRVSQQSTRNYSENDFSTENSIYYRETNRILDEAIEKLPPQQKIIFRLCTIEGHKQRDVALKLNISPLTVKSHLQQAVKTVRNYVQAQNGSFMLIYLVLFVK
ncbi:MAG: RNA polymerase sigma-70 factor [Bacteroidota bacterium]